MMRTLEFQISEALFAQIEQMALLTGLSTSEFMQQLFRRSLREWSIEELEQQEIEAYRQQPVMPGEFDVWQAIELTPKKTVKSAPNDAENQQSVALVVGSKPVAALLPQAKELADMAQFTHLIEDEEIVTLTLNGQPIAVLNLLVPLVVFEENNVDLESLALSTNPKFLQLIEQSRRRHQAEGGISSDEVRRLLEIS